MGFLRNALNRLFPDHGESKSNPVGMVDVSWKVGKPQRQADSYKAYSEEAYGRCVVVKQAIDKVAKCVAHIPLKLMRFDTDGDGIAEEIKDDQHPLKQLMKRPNPTQRGYDFIEQAISYYLLWGNSYTIGAGDPNTPPTELWSMRPDRVQIIPSVDNTPGAYKYTNGNRERTFPVDFVNGRSAILHFKTFNPLDDYYGMPPLRAAALQVDQHNSAAEWNMMTLQNSGRPAGAFKYTPAGNTGSILTREQREQLERDIDERVTGPKNARRPLILDGGLDWKEMAMSAVDLDWLEGQRDAARMISLAFGVAPQLLGIPGDSTYNNYEQAKLALYEDTVIPLLDRWLDSLNEWLVPAFGKDLFLQIDLDHVSALAPRRTERWKQINEANFLSINEKRDHLGFEPDPDPAADKIYIPSTMVPIDMSSDAPAIAPVLPSGKPKLIGGEPIPDPNEADVQPTKAEIAIAIAVKRELSKITYGK